MTYDIVLKHAYTYNGKQIGNMIDRTDKMEIWLFKVQLKEVALY